MSRLAFLVLIAMLAVRPAVALDFNNQPGDLPIEVTADQGIEWSQDGKFITARGGAKAVRGEITVLGDLLIAHYRDKDGNTEVWKLEAKGNVTIQSPTETATGSLVVYNVDSSQMSLQGAPAKIVAGTDTISAHEGIVYNETTRIAVARGNAIAVRADKRIRADTLTAHFAEDDTGKLTLQTADAEGNVVITSPTEVAAGDKGTYNAKSGIATLTGSVKITRGDNQLNGGYAQVNLNTGISKLFASPPGTTGRQRVQGLFTPEARNTAPPAGTKGKEP